MTSPPPRAQTALRSQTAPRPKTAPGPRQTALRPEQTAAASTSPPRTAGFVLLIGLLTLLPAVTVDMYLPSLPDVAADLGATHASVQFTITGMLIGGALGQLLVGPWSDRVGRRLPVLVGVSLHVVISLLCLVATSVEMLSALRVLQGLASAGATVVAMAVIRDRYTGAEAARILSRLMLVISAAPLLAPTAGSAIAAQWGWRGVFVALALLGAALVVVVALLLPETLPVERRAAHGVGTSLRGYVELIQDRRFVSLAVIPGFGMGLIMSYVAGSPFVLQEEYGLSAREFAMVFALGGTSLIVGSQTNAALVRHVAPIRLLRAGLPATVLMAALLCVVAAGRIGGIVGFVVALWLAMVMLGFVISNASALALSRHGERAGMAAATIGFLQAGLAGVISPLVGLFGGGAFAMTGVMLASVATALVVLAATTPAYRRDGWLAFHGADAAQTA